MQLTRAVKLALAILVVCGTVAPASAQQKQSPPRRPVIINDPSAFRPPPLPPERTYVAPGPTVAPPMQRVPQVAPLAQPPIR